LAVWPYVNKSLGDCCTAKALPAPVAAVYALDNVSATLESIDATLYFTLEIRSASPGLTLAVVKLPIPIVTLDRPCTTAPVPTSSL